MRPFNAISSFTYYEELIYLCGSKIRMRIKNTHHERFVPTSLPIYPTPTPLGNHFLKFSYDSFQCRKEYVLIFIHFLHI